MRECDVDYDTTEKLRGTNRLVFSADCKEVFYTANHYSSFTEITKWSLNKTSNSWFVVLVIFGGSEGAFVFYVFTVNNDKNLQLRKQLEEFWNEVINNIKWPFLKIAQLVKK